MTLLGAQGDAGSIRVLLDVQLAVAGDQEAARRLAEAVTSTDIQPMDVAQAYIGLAQLALRQGRHDDALAHAAHAVDLTDHPGPLGPQSRAVLRTAAAVVHLCVAEARPLVDPGVRAEALAVELLTRARDEALTSQDAPVLGSWALGGAALAAYRGSFENARELWTLGNRLGAKVVRVFQGGHGARLTAAVAEQDGREPLRERPVVEATDRIRELMDGLLDRLRPSGGTPPAPGA